ncbi:hypothetical protein AB4455_25585 [Vibrio sp. 10N.261.46.E12]|uniref:hypothetical protein n=1 Tax=unclassified Vibrio TaxID=2614977 RepID=UPI0013000475|nr:MULTISPECIES: hypothetical protein [unclassified Vibrio]
MMSLYGVEVIQHIHSSFCCRRYHPHSYIGNACVKNFTHEGNMVLGNTFKTNALIENVSKKSAFEKVSKYVAMDGWHITYSDKDLGIISGSQTVSFGEGKSAPLNILINAKGQDSEISISFSTSMGVYSPSESVMNNFCKMVNSVAN